MSTLSYDLARRVLDAAVSEAGRIESPSSIAVVDQGRELVAFARNDGALLASIEIALGKAYTSASMQVPTAALAEMSRPGQPLYGLETTHSRPLVAFAGGQPLEIDGAFVGAVGVAGGTVDQDDQVARAAVEAVTGGGST